MEIEESYVLEFNPEKRSFHVSKTDEMLVVNRTNYERGIFIYYLPIAIGTWDYISQLGDELHRKIYDPKLS